MVSVAARTKTVQIVNWLAWSGECRGKAKSFGTKETCVCVPLLDMGRRRRSRTLGCCSKLNIAVKMAGQEQRDLRSCDCLCISV